MTELPASTAAAELPAALWRRAASAVYDLFPLLGLWACATAVAVAFNRGQPIAPGQPALQAFLLLVTALYFVGSWTRGGQTIGMRVWRIRVIALDGQPLSAGKAAIRFAVLLLALGVFGLGLVWALFDPRHRMWQDIASKSRVVRIGLPGKSLVDRD